jgi:DNA repair protein RadD
MTLQLRDYQSESVEAVFDYWSNEPGNPLVDLATGTGKSLVMAELIRRIIDGWPDMRVLVATHVAELIEQDYQELLAIWPFAPAGIYSAGLGRRDAHQQIIFAGIQTVHNKAARIGHIDVLMIDEAHLVPANAETMYGRFIAALRTINPDMKVLGLTATPFRLDSGRLDEGDDRLFDKVVYEYGIGQGIAEGFLAPLSSKPTATAFDLSGVGRQGGDYKQGALQAAVDTDDVTEAAVAEIVAKGQVRRSWLIFGAGVEHALHIRDAIRARGISCETITGETPKEERRRIIEDYKNYKIRALTNNSVLTTGFSHKGVDLLAFMRPTLSAALYLQMAGRGTRVLYAPGADLSTVEGRLAAIAAGPKPSCLVMDFAGLVRRHGPVDRVEPKKPGKGDGEAPVKQCPECEELLHLSVMVCSCCGHEFEASEEPKHAATADIAPILSTDKPDWHDVTGQKYCYHDKVGGTPSVRVEYQVGLSSEKLWVCPQHTGFPKQKANRYWAAHGGQTPFPTTVDEFLDRVGELKPTAQIQIKFNKKYNEVLEARAGDRPIGANDNIAERPVARGNLGVFQRGARPGSALAAELDDLDDIPF